MIQPNPIFAWMFVIGLFASIFLAPIALNYDIDGKKRDAAFSMFMLSLFFAFGGIFVYSVEAYARTIK